MLALISAWQQRQQEARERTPVDRTYTRFLICLGLSELIYSFLTLLTHVC